MGIGSRLETVVLESDKDVIDLYPIGDVHLGSGECNEALFARTVAEIQVRPLARWIGTGDFIDAITMKDPRFAAGGLAKWLYDPLSMQDIVGTQLRRFTSMIEPIGSQCIGLIHGNHESKLLLRQERETATVIAAAIRAARGDNANDLLLGYAGMIYLRAVLKHNGVSKYPTLGTLRIYVHHGAGAAATQGAKLNRLERLMHQTDADLVITGHTHTQAALPRQLMGVDQKGRLLVRQQLGVVAGTFLGWSEYAIEKGLDPVVVGIPKIRWHPETGRLWIEGFEVVTGQRAA